jgi:hypothetical protein
MRDKSNAFMMQGSSGTLEERRQLGNLGLDGRISEN